MDFMKEPEKNWWFKVGSLTHFFDFLKPGFKVKSSSIIFENRWSWVRTSSLIVENIKSRV
jgi:hypothetical protein